MIQPILIYLFAALLLSGLQFVNRRRAASNMLTTLFLALQWLLTAHAVSAIGTTEAYFFRYDGLAVLMTCVLTIIATAASAHSSHYLTSADMKNEGLMRAQYSGAMQLLTMALTMAYLSIHLAMTWVFIEITTLSASALIFYRRNAGSIEATWKYVFACSISLVLVYVGILFMGIAMGEVGASGLSVDELSAHAAQLDTFWIKLAFIFIFVGYTAKMSLVPMFTAGIDAKDKAPTPAAAMLSSVVMNAGFVGFYRMYGVVAQTDAKVWADWVVLVTGLVSIFIAAVYLVRVKNVKRLFAYSSVEHMGVVMLGIAAGGIGIYAAILHLVLHALAKSAVFMHIGHLYRIFGTKEFAGMGQYIKFSNTGTFIIIIATLCITAMPPSGLFVTEFTVFKSLIDSHLWLPLVVALVLLTVIVWAIARDMFSLVFLPDTGSEIRRAEPARMPWYEMVFQFILLALSIWLGMCTPECVANLIGDAANIVLTI